MLFRTLFALSFALVATGRAEARNGEEEWSALSTTAIGITGEIVLSPTRLKTELATFPLKLAADIPRFQVFGGVVGARVLQITRPMNPRLLNGNTLCGRTRPRWIAVWREDGGKTLGMAVYDTAKMPSAGVSGACATFVYVR